MAIKTSITKILLILLLGALISGCGGAKSILKQSEVDRTFMLPVKFYEQKDEGRCGVVALSAVLDFYGVSYTDIGSIYNNEINGTKVISIVNYAKEYAGHYLYARTDRVGYDEIAAIIRAGDPVIILQKHNDFNHYSLVKGFFLDERRIIINDGENENVIVSLIKKGDESKFVAIIFSKIK